MLSAVLMGAGIAGSCAAIVARRGAWLLYQSVTSRMPRPVRGKIACRCTELIRAPGVTASLPLPGLHIPRIPLRHVLASNPWLSVRDHTAERMPRGRGAGCSGY